MAIVRIPWDELAESPKKAEQLFDLIMHAEYGDRVRTINGAGGDGGIDAWVQDLGWAFEFKSWTRLGDPQRAQVVRSLKRCLGRNDITTWVLVAPVHPTPGDLDWFAKLRSRYRVPFELLFRDVRWLESKLVGNNEAIARYLMVTPYQKVVELLRELNAEQAGLVGGVNDLLARLAALQARADELSPVWGLDFASRDGQQNVYIRLKPNTPPQPMTVHIDPARGGPDGPELTKAITESLHYGSGVVIEPGHITGVDNEAINALNLPWEQVGMVLPDQRITEGFPRAATLRPQAGDGTTGRPLHLTLWYATRGSHGMHIHGTDSTRMLRLRLRVDRPGIDGSPEHGSHVGLRLQYRPTDTKHAGAVDPESLLRTINVLDALDRSPGMVLMLAGSAEPISLESPQHKTNGYFAPLAGALRDFVVVRDQLDTVLPLPVSWSPADVRNIAILAGLLRGDEVAMPLSTMVCHQTMASEEARRSLAYVEEGYGARIDFEMVGLALPVGMVNVPIDPLFVAFRARVINAAQVTAALTAGEEIVPVDVGPAHGTAVLGYRTPFPGPAPAAA